MRLHEGEKSRFHPLCWPKRLHRNLSHPWRLSVRSWAMNSSEVKRVLEMFTNSINRIIVLYPFLGTDWPGWHSLPIFGTAWKKLVPRVHLTMLGPCRQVNCYGVLVRSVPNHTLVPNNSQSTSLNQKLLRTFWEVPALEAKVIEATAKRSNICNIKRAIVVRPSSV